MWKDEAPKVTSRVGIITINEKGVICSFDSISESLFGYTEKEVLGLNVSILMPEPDLSNHDSYLARYKAKETPRVIGKGREVIGKRKDGTCFPIWLAVNEIHFEGKKLFIGSLMDLTDQKRVESNLSKSLEITNAILTTAVNPIITIDLKGLVQSFNPAAEHLFQYQQSEVLGKNINMLMPEPYHSEHDGYLSRYIATGNPKIIGQGREVEGKKKNGEVFPMHLSVGEMEVANEKMFVGIIADVSKLKEAEKELATNVEVTRAILNTAVNPIITIDEHGVVHSFNPAAEQLFGYKQEVVLGNNVNMLMPEPYHTEHAGYLSRYLKEGHPKVIGQGREVEGQKADGSKFPMHLTVGEMSMSGCRMFVGIVSDMTAIKANELELRKHKDQLEELVSIATKEVNAIIQTAVSGVITVDGDGVIHVFNPAAEQLFGWGKEEIIGKNISLLLADTPFNDEGGIRSKFDLVKTKTVGTGIEVTAMRKNGTTFPANIAVGYTQLNENQHYFVAFISDITEQRETENTLKRAKEEAEAGARAKSAFLANMSHEIRTPMNAIIGFAEVVLYEERLDSDTKSHVETIYKSAKSLLSIINDILDVSKLESGIFNTEQVCFHLPNAITEALQSIEHLFFEKALTLDIKYDPNLPDKVLGDPTRIRQVLLNIVGNAVKFTEKGSVSISVSKGMEKEMILFSVRDTGIGMYQHQIEQVFRSFNQADQSTTRRFGGTGLGTTISKQLVEKMGGEIWVESEIDIGSEFHFTVHLPEATTYEHCLFEDSEVQVEDYFSPRLFKILLAEDLEQNAMLAQIRLKDQGHEVDWVKNGKQVLEMLKRNDYDLILMDVMMPEMDGLEATKAIREQEKVTGEHLSIIALTASVMKEDHDKCIEAGMDAFESKPVQFECLFNTMERCVPAGIGISNDIPTGRAAIAYFINWQPLEGIANVKKALQIWFEERVYFDALVKFGEQRFDDAERILFAIEQDKLAEAKSIAHALKGVASSMELNEIAKQASDLDICIQAKKANDLKETLEKLRSALIAACEAITKLKNANAVTNNGSEKVQFDTDKVHSLLQQIISDTASLNPDLLEPNLQELKKYFNQSDLQALIDAVDEFDFERVANIGASLLPDVSVEERGK